MDGAANRASFCSAFIELHSKPRSHWGLRLVPFPPLAERSRANERSPSGKLILLVLEDKGIPLLPMSADSAA